jgi:hypothetical protein
MSRIQFTELGSAPGTPAANKIAMYAKNDGKVYIKDDVGAETDLTAGAANAMAELVANTILSASAGSISLSSIPASYAMLMLVMQLRTDRASEVDNIEIRFNSDSVAANYYTTSWHISDAGTPAIVETRYNGATAAGMRIINAASGATSPADYFSLLRVYIHNYTKTSFYRHVEATGVTFRSNTAGERYFLRAMGNWQNTVDAINAIEVVPVNGPNFVAESSYALYGIGSA